MRTLKKRLAKVEKLRRPREAEPLVILRPIVKPDGTVSEVIRKVVGS